MARKPKPDDGTAYLLRKAGYEMDPYRWDGLPESGDTIVDRRGKGRGVVTGGRRLCQLESCSGVRIVVRWQHGKMTQPCSEGLAKVKEGVWKIE